MILRKIDGNDKAIKDVEALYLRAFLVPFWARENILKTRISILGHFLSFFSTKKCKTL